MKPLTDKESLEFEIERILWKHIHPGTVMGRMPKIKPKGSKNKRNIPTDKQLQKAALAVFDIPISRKHVHQFQFVEKVESRIGKLDELITLSISYKFICTCGKVKYVNEK